MKTQKNKQKQNKTKKTQKKYTQNRIKQKIKERERVRKKVNLPTHPIFPNDFSHVVYLFLHQKSLEHNPFTLLKLCYLLDAIIFLKAIVFFELFKAVFFSVLLYFSDFSYEIIYIY